METILRGKIFRRIKVLVQHRESLDAVEAERRDPVPKMGLPVNAHHFALFGDGAGTTSSHGGLFW